jgi:hypothetical protein
VAKKDQTVRARAQARNKAQAIKLGVARAKEMLSDRGYVPGSRYSVVAEFPNEDTGQYEVTIEMTGQLPMPRGGGRRG